MKLNIIITITILFIANLLISQNVEKNFHHKKYKKIDNKWNRYDSRTNQIFPILENQISLKYSGNVSNNKRQIIENQFKLALIRKNKLGWYDYQLSTGTLIDTLIFIKADSLISLNEVSLVQIPTYGKYIAQANDDYYPQQWGLNYANDHDIDMPEAWGITTGSSSVVVGILDSGIDWDNHDLGQGSDGYDNIFINIGEDAWTNIDNPNGGNGIDDDQNGYIDDWRGYSFDMNSNDPRGYYMHGSHVAGIVGAKTNNEKGVSGVAGGWNSSGCKMLICRLGYSAPISSVLDDAIIYAVDMGAKVIQLSLSVAQEQAIDDAIQYAIDNQVLIVCSAGNDDLPTIGYPAINPSVLAVGATDNTDSRAVGMSNYGPDLNVAAPGVSIKSTLPGNTYGRSSGTSMAAPFVSGVAALMLSVNSCLSPEQITRLLEKTADKVGGYNYYWDLNRPGHSQDIGYGRLNAHKAVVAAQNMISSTLDLYMHDRFNDIGNDAGYPWTWDFDDSPDIWVRNQDDGLVNQTHQNPEYSSGNPVYVYVRIGNKSCVTSSGNEELSLYWSKASSDASWPQNWDGTSPLIGDKVGTLTIPTLQSGESTILKFSWNIIDPSIYLNWHSCLLARIENSLVDPIIINPNRLSLDVYKNNNVSLRNCIITDIYPGKIKPQVSGVEYPYGSFVYMGNTLEGINSYLDLIFKVPENIYGNPITKEAEVTLRFDEVGWNIIEGAINSTEGVEIIDDYLLKVTEPEVIFRNIFFPQNTRIPIYVGFSFLTEELTDKNEFMYHAIQKYSEEDSPLGDNWTGGIHFKVLKYDREPFYADAGESSSILSGETITFNAGIVHESAIYNWYNTDGELIYTGTNLSVSPEVTETYQLEVISDVDGFKDYDEVTVKVEHFYIKSVLPNPASDNVIIKYHTEKASSGYIAITGTVNNTTSNYILDCNQNQISINISNFLIGSYSIILVCDGVIVDTKTLIIK